jgi:hypothetical protein
MLIWKVIAANPGITRQGIWARVEHDIPIGYATRRFAKTGNLVQRGPRTRFSPEAAARSFVLTETLNSMQRHGHISREGAGQDRKFSVAKEPRYLGNPDAIDETGTKAAEHMALADALRTVEKMLAKADPARRGKPGAPLGGIGWKEVDAVTLLVQALRARGSS